MDHPVLRWKPNLIAKEKTLKGISTSEQSSTLREAIDAAFRHKGKDAVLITRSSSGWTISHYEGSTICKVGFDKLRLGGLSLGGDPLVPQTYIFDGNDRLARITYSDSGYHAEETPVPTAEPTTSWMVEAFVPEEEINHGKNLKWLPRVTLRPTVEELPSTLAWAHQHMPEMKIKAGGSKHSWSRVAMSFGIYIEPQRMKALWTFDQEPQVYRKDLAEDRKYLVRAGSGHTVKEMNRLLWEHGLSFPILGGYDGQTLGGVFSTGTHGSIITRGPLSEMIVSMDFVLADGSVVRIEPINGITDPKAFAAERPSVRLIQDDDYYNAARINIGAMGVIQSYMLRVTDAFHLKEIRTWSNYTEVKEKLTGGKIYNIAGASPDIKPVDMERISPTISDGSDGGFKDQPLGAYHLEILFNPHGDKMVVTTRHPITVTVAEDSHLDFSPPGRDLVRTIERGARFERPAFTTWFQENFGDLLSWGINFIVKLIPSATPGLIDGAMSSLIDDAYVDRSFNVFNVGDGTNQIPALAATIYVPIADDGYLTALDLVRGAAAKFAKARNRYETGPASMRFVKAAKAMLAPDVDVCSFEFIFTGSTTYALDMVEAYEAALKDGLGEANVKVHWGQLVGQGTHRGNRYKEYRRWREIRDELDPTGVFLNEWQQSIL
jgi:FAD/FMN-containing dehydrogenase